jgi:hypothetical protein
MPDVFKQLERMSWRGIEVPLSARSASFSHDDARHKFVFRDGEILEATGVKNWVFRYTIPFREGIAKGPYKKLFSNTLAAFVAACRDRSVGELIDPVLGSFPARVLSFSDDTDVNKRDGTDVSVEFEYAPPLEDLDIDTRGTAGVSGLSSEAGLLDEELTKVDWAQVPSPEPTTDPLSAAAGIGRQFERQGGKLSAALDDLAFRAEKVEGALDALENPQTWPLRRSARRVREVAVRLKQRHDDPMGRIRTVVQRYAATVVDVAANAGMTVEEFLKLNPELARLPFVPAGTPVQRYA